MKAVVGIIIAVIALAGIGGLVMMNNDDSPTNSAQTASSSDSQMEGMDMGPQNAPSSQENTEAVQTDSVEIRNFEFTPAKITIKKGTTVTWTNKDSARHDITPTSGASDFTASELLGQNESYSFTFNSVGTYSYICSPHPYMKGTVEVVE